MVCGVQSESAGLPMSHKKDARLKWVKIKANIMQLIKPCDPSKFVIDYSNFIVSKRKGNNTDQKMSPLYTEQCGSHG